MFGFDESILRVAICLTACLGMAAIARSQQQASDTSDTSRNQAQVKPEASIEQQQQQAEQQAKGNLDEEAIAALTETRNALKAIEAGNNDQALEAIERVTGKINILVARNPATALIPTAAQVDVIDTAPQNLELIQHLSGTVENAVDARDFPWARVLLDRLRSEIRIRTYNLPLATYPNAMQEAARLLDAQRAPEAAVVLRTAVSTLVVVERVIPLPLAAAQAAIGEAQSVRDSDKERALQFLTIARTELDRAKELGYAGEDQEYAVLNDAIEKIASQLRGGEETESAFAKLKDRIAAFFTRQSESQKNSDTSDANASNAQTRR